jgi:hypothetical protein
MCVKTLAALKALSSRVSHLVIDFFVIPITCDLFCFFFFGTVMSLSFWTSLHIWVYACRSSEEPDCSGAYDLVGLANLTCFLQNKTALVLSS